MRNLFVRIRRPDPKRQVVLIAKNGSGAFLRRTHSDEAELLETAWHQPGHTQLNTGPFVYANEVVGVKLNPGEKIPWVCIRFGTKEAPILGWVRLDRLIPGEDYHLLLSSPGFGALPSVEDFPISV